MDIDDTSTDDAQALLYTPYSTCITPMTGKAQMSFCQISHQKLVKKIIRSDIKARCKITEMHATLPS